MMQGNMMRWVVVGVAALIAWAVAKNVDGPIVHWGLTAVVAYLAYTHTAGMAGG
jgi:hypothetical protein